MLTRPLPKIHGTRDILPTSGPTITELGKPALDLGSPPRAAYARRTRRRTSLRYVEAVRLRSRGLPAFWSSVVVPGELAEVGVDVLGEEAPGLAELEARKFAAPNQPEDG